MVKILNVLHREIMKVLKERNATYANPVTSREVGQVLNVTPSYIREQMKILQTNDLVEVRNGRGGGYFIKDEFLWREAKVEC